MSYWQNWQQGKELNNGQYIVEKYLGGGGFGVTYQIKEQRSNKLFALKTLNERQQEQPDFESQQIKFVNEAVALASCYHPHIVKVYPQMFKQEKLWCMVMEHIEGEDLAAYVTQKGVLAESEAISIISKVGDALSYIHQRGLLHRDIKPQNILLRKLDLSPVVIDFGLAREFTEESKLHSMTNAITESFAPVEQYSRQGKFGAWTDVYALAATLYVLLTAELPIPSRFRQHAPLVPPQKINSNLSDCINSAIIKGMEFAPKDRPKSVQEWLNLFTDSASNSNEVITIEKSALSVETVLQTQSKVVNSADSIAILSDNSTAVDSNYKKSKGKVEQQHNNALKNRITEHYNPKLANIYYERGNNSDGFSNYQQAVDNYSEAIKANSRHDNAYYRRGNSYCKLNNYQQAIDDYNQAIKINPNHAAAYRERGNAYFALKDYQLALDSYDRTIELEPKYTSAYQYRGHAYYQLQDYQKAIDDYYEALTIHPKNADTYYAIANAYYQLEDYPEAINSYQSAIELNPDNTKLYHRKIAQIYLDRGDNYYQAEEYSHAVKDYHLAIKFNPSNTNKLNQRITKVNLKKADIYYDSQQYQKAIKQYSAAIKLDKGNAELYRNKIIQCYDHLIESNPNARFYCDRGRNYYLLSNNQAALQDYEQAIEFDSKNSDAYLGKAESLFLLGAAESAIANYGKAINLNPQNLNIYYKRSVAYKKIGKYKEAEADYKRANNINPPKSHKGIISRIINMKII